MRTCIFLVGLLALAAAAYSAEEPVTFSAKPKAAKNGDKTRIEFVASRETDVSVSILDAQGKAIRHLAAGVLNKNAPEPLQPGALKQSIEWDGKDDFGKPAAGGPFKANVRLGMKPELDRFVLYNPNSSGAISAVAVGPGGTLYVFHRDGCANGNMGGNKIKLYTREGKHLRAIYPFPADLASEKLKALGVFQTKEGDLVPHVHNTETLSFYPDTGERGRDMPDVTSSPAVDSKGRVYWLVEGPKLAAVDADGGIPYETFHGPKLLTEIKDLRLAGAGYMYWSETPSLAVSSDDKFVYFAGLSQGAGDWKAAVKLPCVFRVPADKRGPAEAFVGKLGQPGKEKDLLTAPRGLAVAKGMLYVADTGADRVAIFKEADRSFAGEIKVKEPHSVGVDPGTGAVYVCSYTNLAAPDLVKFDASGKEVCRITLPRTGQSPNPGVHRIAVDASTKPVQIWVPEVPYGGVQLLCIEDEGAKFVSKGDPRALKEPLWAEGPRDLSFDRVRGELYVKVNARRYCRVDDATGLVKENIDPPIPNIDSTGTQLVVGSDGNLYTDNFGCGLFRFDRAGKPLNWNNSNSHIIPAGGIMCFQNRSLALKPFAPPDELYRVAFDKYSSVNVYGQDGSPRRTVVWQCYMGASPRVDAKGNIYLADQVKPPDRSYPEFFDGKLPPPPTTVERGDLYWNSYMYGSIVKFPPSGGAIWSRKEPSKTVIGEPPSDLLAKPKVKAQTHFAYSAHCPAEIQGALWVRFGFAPYSGHSTGNTSQCMCEGTGFDVDPYGRVFFPNLGQFRVEVVDTNNNPITTIGKYGNEDSGGKDAKVKKPDIPLAWPTYVAVSDNYAYIGDTTSRRVVRVKLGSAAEETISLP